MAQEALNQNGSTFSPSRELNKAFSTPILAFRDKINNFNWLEEAYPPRRMERSIYEVSSNSLPKIGVTDLFGLYPSIFTEAQGILIYQKPVIGLYSAIGEYGKAWSVQLMLAAETLTQAATHPASRVNILDEVQELNESQQDLLNRYTHRRTQDPQKNYSGPLVTLMEGFQSVFFVAGFLTAYKVDGYENMPGQLLSDLAESHAFSHLALAIAPTFTGTMGNQGWVFTNPTIERSVDELLATRRDIIDHFIRERKGAYNNLTSGEGESLDKPGCPVGRVLPNNKFSGIDTIAIILSQIVLAQKNLKQQ